MGGLYVEDVEVGDMCTAGSYLVTRDEIIEFAKRYDPVPENLDEKVAARSIFGGLTACSPHTFSIYILLTTQLRPEVSSQSAFRAPILVYAPPW
jgi:acyl dehydratase